MGAVLDAGWVNVYHVDDRHQQTSRIMTGRELASLELRLEIPRNSVLVRYVGKREDK